MTSRTRKLTGGVVVVVIAAVVAALIMISTKPDSTPRIALKSVRYDFDRKTALIEVTNLSGFEVSYVCLALILGSNGGSIPPHGTREVTLAMTGLSKSPPDVPGSAGKVMYWRTPGAFEVRVRRFLQKIRMRQEATPPKPNWLEIAIDLPPPPPPPKTPLP